MNDIEPTPTPLPQALTMALFIFILTKAKNSCVGIVAGAETWALKPGDALRHL